MIVKMIVKKTEKRETIDPVNIRLHSIIKAATGGYEKQRILKFNPINGAKIEVMRFNTQKNPKKSIQKGQFSRSIKTIT